MKKYLFAALTTSLAVPCVYGAAYSTDFNSFVFEGDVAGQDGWTVSNATDQYSQIAESNINRLTPLVVTNVLQLGDAKVVDTPPPVSSVSLTHDYTGTVGQTNVAFDFLLLDSRTSAGSPFLGRDQFSISISDGGSNIFSIGFIPDAQSATPSATEAQWNLVYQLGAGPSVDLNLAVFESGQYQFNLGFTSNTMNPALTDFLLTIKSDATPAGLSDGVTNGLRNSDGFNTGYSLGSAVSTGEFNVTWTKTPANAEYGSNSILIDNLVIVPEPSSSLLLCLAGLGFVTRRKRA